MATATRSVKTRNRRSIKKNRQVLSGSEFGGKREQVKELSHRDRDYLEAPERPEECFEQPEAKFENSTEAPDAGEGRCDPSEEYFTHGRSWS